MTNILKNGIYKSKSHTNLPFIDFRSDTFTKPTLQMLQYAIEQPVGDDVFDEDPTVFKLQSKMAELCGKEASLYMASGSMSNQVAIQTHIKTVPASVICDKNGHVYKYEAGGIGYHTGAQVIPIQPKKHLSLLDIKNEIILDEDIHHCPTKLICLENSLNGTIMSLQSQQEISRFAHDNNVKMHLDGARLWNVCIETGKSMEELCAPYDSISICFSKGMGCPIGSVLIGSHIFIQRAKHIRKLFGGGWRQAYWFLIRGVMAGCCMYSIDNNLSLLKETHQNAVHFAHKLTQFGAKLSKPCETNMVWIDTTNWGIKAQELAQKLQEKGILVFDVDEYELRFVFHFQQLRKDIDIAAELINEIVQN